MPYHAELPEYYLPDADELLHEVEQFVHTIRHAWLNLRERNYRAYLQLLRQEASKKEQDHGA